MTRPDAAREIVEIDTEQTEASFVAELPSRARYAFNFMEVILHIMQINVNADFAYHAMERFCTPCKPLVMRIRLREFRDRAGMTLEAMAERSGFSVSQLSRWESGASNIPSERLPVLAAAYQCRIADIFDEDESPYLQLGPTLQVKGAVAAGVWLEAREEPEDDWRSFTGRPDVVAPIRDRFGLQVEGDSMNDLYPPGTIVECVSFLGGAEIESGRRVIVERVREDGEREVTVKEYIRGDDGAEWLMPRSSNPAFQTPYKVGERDQGIAEVRILAVVVASYRYE